MGTGGQDLRPRDPIFVLDSRERFHPLAVESVEGVGAKIAGSGEPATLASLPPEGGRIDLPSPPDETEQLREEFGGVGYRRRVEGGGLIWVQYWLWYVYNPKAFVIAGNHEGDWEFVQVGYAGEQPVCLTASQHRGGGARMWWDAERRQGRPVVYVARDSHANFFEPVDQIPIVQDEGDGRGETLDRLEWRDFGPWQDWPGLWGNSTGQGRSPQSPGCQGERWSAPHRYHSKASYQP